MIQRFIQLVAWKYLRLKKTIAAHYGLLASVLPRHATIRMME
jgi:hypothetical protein